jgi:hypothetical protein
MIRHSIYARLSISALFFVAVGGGHSASIWRLILMRALKLAAIVLSLINPSPCYVKYFERSKAESEND